ncbi:MAG: stage II sporulation protein P [Clostridia bacterium]|nr:stage II sporulation protein P [Clostridia bacterium]MDD4686316.1 stage II sporulation protein P [Clostridia bacterium]
MRKILILFAFVCFALINLLTIYNILINQKSSYLTKPIFAQNIESSLVKNENGEIVVYTYLIFDKENNFLAERTDCEVGDRIIDKDFNVFEVYYVDNEFYLAKAKFIETLRKNKITKKQFNYISELIENKKIGLYMTHNDESYIIGDGTDSIYGKGGIHDIAKELAYKLENKNIDIILDETLHIPHNSTAYARSRPTAIKLLNENVSALFDIHRDGIPREHYITNINETERCQIRIVVGLSNANKEKNLEFAKYLIQVGEELYPWLFKDIYMAKNNYNQDLTSKCLLFEMGTYTMEKDMVFDSTTELAEIINTTLFNTTIDIDGNLTINGDKELTIDEYFNNQSSGFNMWIMIFISSCLIIFIMLIMFKPRKCYKNFK